MAVDGTTSEIHVNRGVLSPPRKTDGREQIPGTQVVHSLGYAVIQFCAVNTVDSPIFVITFSVYVISRAGLRRYCNQPGRQSLTHQIGNLLDSFIPQREYIGAVNHLNCVGVGNVSRIALRSHVAVAIRKILFPHQ